MSDEIRTVEVVAQERRYGCLIQVLRVTYAGDPPEWPADHEVTIFLPDGKPAFSQTYETESWELALNEGYEWVRRFGPHEYRYAPETSEHISTRRGYVVAERGRALAHLLKTGSAAV